ncbi:MAG: HAD-IIA family hydrolase [Propionibacteriaceae bacterium]|nr:HAD-IIA family hydrolase [Propionibacteriaceae bacterium]
MSRLIDRYDASGFDLDGVIYRGPDAVPGAAAAIAGLRDLGVKVGFVTNNAQRPPQAVVDHLNRIGIPTVAADVVTSAQAEARLMAAELPAGAEVLVVGSEALADELRGVGLAPVFRRSAATAAIVVGFEPSLTWEDFNQGCYAVQAGARYFACNNDQTRPTDQGIAIGMGGMLAAMERALPGLEPPMAGKPFRPLLDETVRRLGAERMVFVGDRLDTDIEGAVTVGLDSLFVLSGSHGKAHLAAAGPQERPTWLAWDVRGLLEEPRVAVVEGAASHCRGVTATVADGAVTLDVTPADAEGQADALWAVLTLTWAQADAGTRVNVTEVLEALDLVP